jgi:mono/diheme cytochrome c family protein
VRRRWIILAIVACGLGIAAALAIVNSLGGRGAPASVQLTPVQDYGRSLYNGNCAACHEVNQLNLTKVPPNLHVIFAQGHLSSGVPATDDAVRQLILHGKDAMPSFDRRLTPSDIDAIIAYLHTGIK